MPPPSPNATTAATRLPGDCIAFLLIDDYVAPSPEAIASGVLERMEQATPLGLSLVFGFLEEMKVGE